MAILKDYKIYRTYVAAKGRCNNIKGKDYHNYGGRGIKMLWDDFNSFSRDMYMSFLIHVSLYGEYNTTLERIDVNGHYCKDNPDEG